MSSYRPRCATVADVMSTQVVTVNENARFHEVAEILYRHRISAAPVVDDAGAMIGIVSEGDLIPKTARPADALWPRRHERAEQRKARAQRARELMTQPVVSCRPTQTLTTAARRMLDANVKRLPVCDEGGRLVGIVSRHDLLRGFNRTDEEIRRDIVEGVMPYWMGIDPATVDVSVVDGEVLLRGGVERQSDISTLVHLTRVIDGVVSVESDLTAAFDDTHVPRIRERHIA